MGRFSGLASALSVVADRLRSQRETGEQLNLLGQTQQIKNLYPSEVEKAQAGYYTAQSEFLNKQKGLIGSGDLVYRAKATGQEVPEAMALQDPNLTDNYDVYRKNITKSGITETPIIKIPEEKITAADVTMEKPNLLDYFINPTQISKYKQIKGKREEQLGIGKGNQPQISPQNNMVTIQDITGRIIQMPRLEAIKKGYING